MFYEKAQSRRVTQQFYDLLMTLCRCLLAASSVWTRATCQQELSHLESPTPTRQGQRLVAFSHMSEVCPSIEQQLGDANMPFEARHRQRRVASGVGGGHIGRGTKEMGYNLRMPTV